MRARRRRRPARRPWSVSTNSRTWLEWAVPRLLITNSSRLRSPLLSWLRSSSQVSTSEETSTSLALRRRPWREGGHHGGDAAALEQVEVARDRPRSRRGAARAAQAGHGVEHDQLGLGARRAAGAAGRGAPRSRRRWAAPSARAAGRRRPSAAGRARSSACCASAGRATPRRRRTARARRGRRRRRPWGRAMLVLPVPARAADHHRGAAVDAAGRASRRAAAMPVETRSSEAS